MGCSCLLVCICVSVSVSLKILKRLVQFLVNLRYRYYKLFLEILQINCPYFKQYLSAQNSNLNCSWNLTLLIMINFVTLCQSYCNVVIFLEIIPKKKYCNTHQLFFKGLSFLLSEDYSTLFSCYLSLMDLNLTKPVYLFPG